MDVSPAPDALEKASRSLFAFIWPRSLLSRTLMLTLVSVLMAQVIATSIWFSQSRDREMEGLKSASDAMAQMFASTTKFFESLPMKYRHIALDQLRNMGGARFFVSFNKEKITIDAIPDNELKTLSLNTISKVLHQKLPNLKVIDVEFSRPETLHVLNNNILLSDLPRSWAHYTLTLQPLNPPILVVQIQLAENEWLYIAGLLPAPYVTLEDNLFTVEQAIFITAITALLLIFTGMLIRRQTKPLRHLAEAADRLSMSIDQPPIKEEGAAEIITATRAFNRMQMRLQRYIKDRESLFSAISHDLKTPITRLRLRAELLDDETTIDKFNKDLDELEIMVKGALQTVKDTDIHENLAEVDINLLLESIAEVHNATTENVRLNADTDAIMMCKPLAIKRSLSNLIDNAVLHGGHVEVYIFDDNDKIRISIQDDGPGIPETSLNRVFAPYYRINTDAEGSGLGLGIARNIIHAHGGELVLSNRDEGGLSVDISLPRLFK
ncbi:ATP-binding protein [Parasalinivibrio latis]|uniref:ATP-binding protein n=1 Tax=Parasalinivibrio latis TaxID=2952610 RepID=UPI003DA504B4